MAENVSLYAINKYDINLKNQFKLIVHNKFILVFPRWNNAKSLFWLEILKANN